ncbi:hypothetical protein [Derxia gummosa]|uniref:Uncharacterized protein n=1 Tax=Derxia gummosa DSM 723 TaxID=1121388 RepID=A0A8B6X6A4_9BURK|nr:hypothetical protein [Derxia gummosa]
MLYHVVVFLMIAILAALLCVGGSLLASVGVTWLLAVFVAMALMSFVSDLVVGVLEHAQDRQPRAGRS